MFFINTGRCINDYKCDFIFSKK